MRNYILCKTLFIRFSLPFLPWMWLTFSFRHYVLWTSFPLHWLAGEPHHLWIKTFQWRHSSTNHWLLSSIQTTNIYDQSPPCVSRGHHVYLTLSMTSVQGRISAVFKVCAQPISAKTSHVENKSTQKTTWAASTLVRSAALNKKGKRSLSKNTWWLSKANSHVRKQSQALTWDRTTQAPSVHWFWITASPYPSSAQLLFSCFHLLSFWFLPIVVASLKRSMNRSYSPGVKTLLFSFKL